jgi:hypothetical protein
MTLRKQKPRWPRQNATNTKNETVTLCFGGQQLPNPFHAMVYHSQHMVPLLLVSAFLSVGFFSMWAIYGGTPPPRPGFKSQSTPPQPLQVNTVPSTASQKPPVAEDDGQTSWKCHARGAWSDLCEYKNVCFDSFGQLVFVFKDGQKADKHWGVRNPGMKMATKIPLSGMNEARAFPVHYSGESYRIVTPDELAALDPMWTASSTQQGKAVYVTSYTDELANIWYYSTRILPLFTAERDREALGLPEIGEVIIPMRQSKIDHDWHLKVLKLALPSDDIPVHYAEVRRTRVYFVLCPCSPSRSVSGPGCPVLRPFC